MKYLENTKSKFYKAHKIVNKWKEIKLIATRNFVWFSFSKTNLKINDFEFQKQIFSISPKKNTAHSYCIWQNLSKIPKKKNMCLVSIHFWHSFIRHKLNKYQNKLKNILKIISN